MKSSQIRVLVHSGVLQLGLFDERNLFEFSHPDFPGEQLMACRNVDLGKLRGHKREALLVANEKELQKVRARIENGSLTGRDKTGVRVGKVVNKYKVAKHFALTIEETGFEFKRLEPQIAAEAALDGLYVIRTRMPKKQMTSAEAVRSYKALAEVERASHPPSPGGPRARSRRSTSVGAAASAGVSGGRGVRSFSTCRLPCRRSRAAEWRSTYPVRYRCLRGVHWRPDRADASW
jgi:hypothetical protein